MYEIYTNTALEAVLPICQKYYTISLHKTDMNIVKVCLYHSDITIAQSILALSLCPAYFSVLLWGFFSFEEKKIWVVVLEASQLRKSRVSHPK